ncbi:DUF4177 domain-containing protein [Corynebacterium maris]|uniref:DUF4177 domain-containing protein n=1 Tax=Corynebacterium maris TaxID=575200 RepID=UPI00040E179E|nr:DUF4177 domain-containing protein [Corynebacterium maris]
MEYKVLDMDNALVDGRLEGATLESALNEYAADGWRYSALITAAHNQLFLLLERDEQAKRVG